jgi:hypothetical protein
MSVILEALKKLDRENSSRRNITPNIAAEILRTDSYRPRKRSLLYFVTVSIATATITYIGVMEFGFLEKSLPPMTINDHTSRQQVSSVPPETSVLSEKSSLPAPIEPLTSTKQASTPPSETHLPKTSPPADSTPPALIQSPEPIRGSRDETIRVSPKIKSDAEEKITSTFPGEKKTSPGLILEEAKVTPTETIKLPEQTQYQPTTAPLSLRLSGIIWSEDPSKRIAVINGSTMAEGSVIEGVKVVEIHPTRVRFSQNNQFFEIQLGGSFTNKALD